MKDQLGDAKVVGHSMMETADIEAILACEPDLIIMAPRQEKIYDRIKRNSANSYVRRSIK